MLNSIEFKKCGDINEQIERGEIEQARESVICLLDELRKKKVSYSPLLNHLIRKVGLFPYIEPQTALWDDRVVVELFKADVGAEEPAILHSTQSLVLKHLLQGENIAISAPTSFGKSFIIDAFISLKKPSNIVIIVPTIALADETRRRLEHKFSSTHKIITTAGATLGERNIFIFPQERCFSYLGVLKSIDLLVVDEFYKASSIFNDERGATLLTAMIELGKISHQRYYLAPNIRRISDNVFTQGMKFMNLTGFQTVVTEFVDIYSQRKKKEPEEEFKGSHLLEILRNHNAKTLIYAGSYNNIKKISNIVINNINPKSCELLSEFHCWLEENYGPSFFLCKLVERGIGIHNGRMHRSLSQLQIRLFEETSGLDAIVSTSSIIEGVNTQAEQVVVWSNKNGNKKFNYFTYRNIAGRAGRMFKYFVGKVFLLVEPPLQEDTTLTLDLPNNVVEQLDSDNPGIQISNEQSYRVKQFENYMKKELGDDTFHKIRNLPEFRSFNLDLLKELIKKIRSNSEWPRNYQALASKKANLWKEPLNDVLDYMNKDKFLHKNIKFLITKMSISWYYSLRVVYNEEDLENLFAAERFISYHLCNMLTMINVVKKALYPNSPDISYFIGRASNLFLPRLVYQLEEYGVPRMVSKKIQDSGIIDLEDETSEISAVVEKFKEIGCERLISELESNLLPFDKYIIRYFYEGIS